MIISIANRKKYKKVKYYEQIQKQVKHIWQYNSQE